MYLGITSHRSAQRVRCYADAQAALERASETPTGRARTEKPDGFPLGNSRGVTWVRPNDDGSIAFTLYATDVVVWHPDNSFEIDNFGSVTTSEFAARFTPDDIHLRYPVQRRGESGGDRGISYHPVGGDDWHARWREARICFGTIVRFRETAAGGWAPDEDTLTKVVFPELDRAAARKMSKALHLRDFESWLGMAPHHLDLEHEGFDVGHCALALKHRDFALAACHLPTVKADTFGRCHDDRALPIPTRKYGEIITLGSVSKLKLALWEDAGILKDAIFRTIGLREFHRRMARVRALDALGFYGVYGPV